MGVVIREVENAWSSVQKFLYVPQNEEGYNRLVGLLDQLISQVGKMNGI